MTDAGWALVAVAPERGAALLARWGWLVDRPVRLVALSLFGDLFVEETDGSISIVDALEGVVRRAAASRATFDEEVARGSDLAREWLLLDTVELLQARGVRPGPGQCYGWKVPPLIGAPMTTDNVELFEIDRYQSIVSAFLEAIRSARRTGE